MALDNYLNTVWLPVAGKFSNAFTKRIPHFNQQTTLKCRKSQEASVVTPHFLQD
ncbi:hypothetical protein VP01_398g3 [Puccinia sorghi]|uniref:Uncharacterized protein n=1 Tax=Puccinia sorghi TaxID=27349 RepID=A0A0L6UT20_9BASI|nr:hypothetical protein VP01_398g3 [Puccinia sorghi]